MLLRYLKFLVKMSDPLDTTHLDRKQFLSTKFYIRIDLSKALFLSFSSSTIELLQSLFQASMFLSSDISENVQSTKWKKSLLVFVIFSYSLRKC
jgi:hypothetical protein